jgi:hypothetical protein
MLSEWVGGYAGMRSWKTVIGPKLKARSFEDQETEGEYHKAWGN